MGIIRIKHDRVGIYCNIMYVPSPTLAHKENYTLLIQPLPLRRCVPLTHLFSGFLMQMVESKGKSQNWKGRQKKGQVARLHL